MLDIITKSKTRQKLLRLLFLNKNQKFYLSEIAEKISVSIGTTQRELNKLAKFDIVTSEKKGNMRYYFINKQNQFLRELKKIIKATIGIEIELRNIIKGIHEIKYAFIFGSYVKGELKQDSDIDLVIIGDTEENKIIIKINKLEKSINRQINYHLYQEKDFRQKIKKDSFLKNIIKNYLLLTNNEDEFKKIFR